MKVSLIQMDMKFASPDENFAHAEELIRQAAWNFLSESTAGSSR